MSAKISTMSAGRAGSSKYNVNVNGNQGGGNKKGGLAPTTNKRVSYVLRAIQRRAYSSPDQRKMIYCVNQLGGIGAPTKMFATGADGSCSSCSKEATANNFVILAYRQLLGRGVDNSGLRKYTKQILNDHRGLCVGMSQVVFDLTNSPEGRKYMNKLGSVEAQKHRAIVNEYIKKACTVVPVLSSSEPDVCYKEDLWESESVNNEAADAEFVGTLTSGSWYYGGQIYTDTNNTYNYSSSDLDDKNFHIYAKPSDTWPFSDTYMFIFHKCNNRWQLFARNDDTNSVYPSGGTAGNASLISINSIPSGTYYILLTTFANIEEIHNLSSAAWLPFQRYISAWDFTDVKVPNDFVGNGGFWQMLVDVNDGVFDPNTAYQVYNETYDIKVDDYQPQKWMKLVIE
ncbi:hypothetical protein OAA43_01225 [bacterium]|nr:hypothetical protein [bacterium]